MTDSPERALLESKSRDELVEIAQAAGLALPSRARKAAIVDALLGGGDADDASTAPTPEPAADEVESSGPKVRRVRRTAESDGELRHEVAE